MSLRSAAVTGILLAAGRGSRFSPDGRQEKLLSSLPDGTPIAVASLRLLLPVCGRVITVVRPEAQVLSSLLAAAGAEVVICEEAAQGMGASLACAARASLPQAAPCIVALADMPWIRPATVAQVVALLAVHPVVAPFFEGRRGHPVGFASSLLPALAGLSGDSGARHLLEGRPIYRMDCDDAGVLRDVDTPGDLEFDSRETRAGRFTSGS
jgi:molybdenum cofactor cytidylyltransferase